MAQLTSDLAAIGHKLMTLDECLLKITRDIAPLKKHETVKLKQSHRRILSRDVKAKINLPPFDNSAVDGYAVVYKNIMPQMKITARIAAGDKLHIHYNDNDALRIFTGAPMPPQFDTVFMQEDVTVEGENVTLPQGLPRYANMRKAGEDVRAGELVASENLCISPRHIALLAACGHETVTVKAKLRVGVFSTGNEIKSLGENLSHGQIFDSNRYMLLSLLTSELIETIDLGILPDNQAVIEKKLREASQTCDLLITSGGVSMGEEDHVKNALLAIGDLDFWRLGIKPGRPVAMGRIGEARFVGLPGNPVAVFVTYQYVVKPMIAALLGVKYTEPLKMTVYSGFDYKKKAGRREYLRVSIINNIADKHAQDGAGVISSLTQTDGLLELPDDMTLLKAGDAVSFIPYDALL